MLLQMFTKLDSPGLRDESRPKSLGVRCAVWGDLWRDEEALDEDIWRGGGVSRRCGTWLGESEGWWRWRDVLSGFSADASSSCRILVILEPILGFAGNPRWFCCSNLGRRLWRPGWWVPSYDLIDDRTLEMFLTWKKAWSETIHLHFHENKVWAYGFALLVMRSITATSCFDGLDPTGI